MTTLNASQTAAVQSDSPHILCLAGPGSGKTRGLVERIRRLALECDAAQIVAITFTNSAAREMRSRLGFEIGFCGTLHSFVLNLIHQHRAAIGYSSSKLTVLDERQTDELLMRCADDLSYSTSLKALKRIVVGSETANEIARATMAGQLVWKRFHSICKSNGLISYDEILRQGVRLLNSGIELPYDHLLVDEYQDTSELDAAIYEALPIPNKFFVGDDMQSIFGFRGASVDFILEKAREIDCIGGELIMLEENYRSDRAICAAGQSLASHSKTSGQKKIRPISEVDGIVTVKSYSSGANEIGVTILAIDHAAHVGSVGILLRTNRLVDEWRTALAHVGLPVTRKSGRPADWPLVMAAIAVLNDPENDWLCYSLIRLKEGEETANAIQTSALASGTTINAFLLHLCSETPLSDYTPILSRLGVSSESLQIVNQAIEVANNGAELMAILAGDEPEQPSEGIFVGTIHSAKGLEFDTVFLPAFEQEVIPAGRAVEEERRLAFVGMTRARHALHISHAKTRRGYGGMVPAMPSQFIEEAGLTETSR